MIIFFVDINIALFQQSVLFLLLVSRTKVDQLGTKRICGVGNKSRGSSRLNSRVVLECNMILHRLGKTQLHRDRREIRFQKIHNHGVRSDGHS